MCVFYLITLTFQTEKYVFYYSTTTANQFNWQMEQKQLFAIKFPTFALIMHEIAFKLMSNVFVVNFSLGELQIIICLNDSKSG